MSSVLVVDDEGAMRELLKRFLADQGHFIREARTAEEALDAVAQTPDVCVVVADLQMPGRGGAWLVEELKRTSPNVAVVLATANDAVPGTLTLQSSVVSYIVKPVDKNRLCTAVEQGMAWHDQQAAREPAPAADADPFEAFLNRKLTRGSDDAGNR